MKLSEVRGQDVAVGILRRSLSRGRLHHALRFEGPRGVGKQTTAFALAASLLCERPASDHDACGECGACRRVRSQAANEGAAHPDLVVLGRGLHSPAVLGTDRPETDQIGVAQVRKLVLGRVAYAPHEGRALVFIVRDADELGPAAANALLKTLEEPRPRVVFVLVTARPRRLLDTVRSRTLPVRFGPWPEALLAEQLRARGLDPGLAARAEGSLGRALELADADAEEARRGFVTRFLAALDAPDPTGVFALTDRGGLEREALRERLGDVAAELSVRVRRLVEEDPDRARQLAERHARILQTVRELEHPVAAPLALEALAVALRRS